MLAAERLLESLSLALRRVPSATRCEVFGSLASGRADSWSDVDVYVRAFDPVVARAGLVAAVDAAIPLLLAWPFPGDVSGWILLGRGLSVFQRVDVSLLDEGGVAPFGPVKVLWRQPAAASGLGAESGVWAPVVGSPEHAVIGEMLGAVRYVKFRARGDRVQMVRKASGALRAASRVGLGVADVDVRGWSVGEMDRLVTRSVYALAGFASVDLGVPSEVVESLRSAAACFGAGF